MTPSNPSKLSPAVNEEHVPTPDHTTIPSAGDQESARRQSYSLMTSRASSRSGRWTPDEKLLFLYGLKVYGRGRWKKIRQFLPTRTLIQIKSHAQKVLKRDELGDNVFLPLKANKEKIDSLLNDRSRLFQQESAPTLMSSDGRYHTIPLQQQQHHHQQQHQKITVAAATKSDHSPQLPHGQQPAPIYPSPYYNTPIRNSGNLIPPYGYASYGESYASDVTLPQHHSVPGPRHYRHQHRAIIHHHPPQHHPYHQGIYMSPHPHPQHDMRHRLPPPQPRENLLPLQGQKAPYEEDETPSNTTSNVASETAKRSQQKQKPQTAKANTDALAAAALCELFRGDGKEMEQVVSV